MAIQHTHKPDPRDVDAAWNEQQDRREEAAGTLSRWEKISWAIEHLVAAGDYDRHTIETGTSDELLLDVYALEHDETPTPAPADTDVSPWLWETR